MFSFKAPKNAKKTVDGDIKQKWKVMVSKNIEIGDVIESVDGNKWLVLSFGAEYKEEVYKFIDKKRERLEIDTRYVYCENTSKEATKTLSSIEPRPENI